MNIARAAERLAAGWPASERRRACWSPTSINVRYLTGYTGSQRRCGGTRRRRRVFLTDFRYLERVAPLREFIDVRQANAGPDPLRRQPLRPSCAGRRPDRLRVGAPVVRRSRAAGGGGWRRRAGGAWPAPSRAFGPSRTPRRSRPIRRAGGHPRAGLRAAGRRGPGRTHASSTWPGGSGSWCASTAATASPSTRSWPPARPARCRTPSRGDEAIDPGSMVTIDIGAVLDGYHSDCTRTFATGPVPDAAGRGLRAGAEGAAGRSRRGAARRHRQGRRRGRARHHRRGRPRRALPARHRPRRRSRRSTRIRACRVTYAATLEPGWSSQWSRASTCPGVGGVRIEDLVVVTGGRLRAPHRLP